LILVQGFDRHWNSDKTEIDQSKSNTKAHLRWESKVQIPRNQFGLIWNKGCVILSPCHLH
jgi:hypothetical protein